MPSHPDEHRLKAVYSPKLEKLCRDAYPRDYLMFGFSDFDVEHPA
jgi:hypothetical protein